MPELFIDENGKSYGEEEIRNALLAVGAHDCETLFIHSDIVFGKPGRDFRRKAYLNTWYEILLSIGVKYLVIPAFTYSFCNHEAFDVRKSATSMGALNEFIRKKEGRYRTMDPLLSLSVPMEWKDYFRQYEGEHSLGEGGGLDAVHHMDGVKFLFLGAEVGDCFTYVHYVEKMLEVPYRFDMRFSGSVIDENGNRTERIQYMHTQCYGITLPAKYDYFEEELAADGILKRERLGDKWISCLDEKDAYREISSRIKKDLTYFVVGGFTEADLVHQYTYDAGKGRITHC